VEIDASCWLPINTFFSLRKLYEKEFENERYMIVHIFVKRNIHERRCRIWSRFPWFFFFFALDIFRDFTPPPRRQSGLHSCVVLRSINLLLPTLRDNLTLPYLRVSLLKMGMTGRPETSVTSYQLALRNIPEEQRFRENWIIPPYCEWFRPIVANKIRVFT